MHRNGFQPQVFAITTLQEMRIPKRSGNRHTTWQSVHRSRVHNPRLRNLPRNKTSFLYAAILIPEQRSSKRVSLCFFSENKCDLQQKIHPGRTPREKSRTDGILNLLHYAFRILCFMRTPQRTASSSPPLIRPTTVKSTDKFLPSR